MFYFYCRKLWYIICNNSHIYIFGRLYATGRKCFGEIQNKAGYHIASYYISAVSVDGGGIYADRQPH